MEAFLKTSNVSTEKAAVRTTFFSLAGNLVVAIFKGLAGYFGNSFALMADALESVTDVFSSILVLIGLKYASRPADKNHPYGHGRVEPLVTFLVVGFLMVSASFIAYESIRHIQTPHDLPEPYTLLVLAVIIIWKEISYRIVLKKSKETQSTALKADAWHHRSDAITSVAAFLGISIALYLGKGYESADDWAALFASGFIFYNCFLIFRPALGEILDEHVHDDLIEKIRTIAQTVPGVADTEKCLIRKVGMTFFVDLHAHVDGSISVSEGHEISHRLKDTLQRELPQLAQVLIHIEPSRTES